MTNNVTEDPRVHNREWAAKLGLTSFAGYRLLSSTKEPIGVLALFSKHKCSSDDDALLQNVASTTSQVIQTAMAEEALRESEQRYRTLTDDVLDTSAVGLFILDASFRVVWVNQAMERYFGIRREQVIGKDKRQLIHAYIKRLMEDPDDFIQKVFATYDNNTYVETFECHVLPDGDREDRWLEHWSQPIHSGLYRGGAH